MFGKLMCKVFGHVTPIKPVEEKEEKITARIDVPSGCVIFRKKTTVQRSRPCERCDHVEELAPEIFENPNFEIVKMPSSWRRKFNRYNRHHDMDVTDMVCTKHLTLRHSQGKGHCAQCQQEARLKAAKAVKHVAETKNR